MNVHAIYDVFICIPWEYTKTNMLFSVGDTNYESLIQNVQHPTNVTYVKCLITRHFIECSWTK